MAGQFTRLQKSYMITDADGIALYRGVVMDGANKCKKPVGDNEIPLGVVDNDERLADGHSAGGDQTGKQIAVKLEGIASIELEDSVTAGDRVILAIGGTAKKCPTTTGTYNILGFAEKDGIKGDVVPVRMSYHLVTITE